MGGADDVDYYELLDVDRNASPAEIKSAFRNLARTMHPDAGGTPGAFRLLQIAFETLHDPVTRAEYDSSGKNGTGQPLNGQHESWAESSRFDDATLEELAFEAFGGTRRTTRPRARRTVGSDPNYVPPTPRVDPATIDWWFAPGAGERAQFSLREATGHAPAGWVGGVGVLCLLLVVLPLNLPTGVFVAVLAVLAGTVVAGALLARRYLATAREDKEFAAEFGDRVVFGRPGVERDEVDERRTADLLTRYLTRLSGVRVFHGLALPDSVFADVDHAVLCGKRLVLIDSKLWLPGHYTIDETGQLWRDSHRFLGGETQLPDALAAFRELLPGAQIRGALIIYPSRSGKVTADAPETLEAPPMTPDQFVRNIGRWLAEDPCTLDRNTFHTLLDQVVAPG
ncbi:DnaJ-like protein [Tamaricihabitans halophyticus]|uniref:DnaJ-like protein n=1 Tax=Tamaricihabitans halophyticus TaxID=1262583 RepID=A0A4R2QZE2_9PSEU|nr:DnaJ domain-containing protein [Tamaricihabitans halophyticus]TCP55057.1 DnaJ-like protein [Tamaricihabitans halophyticus]